MFEASATAALLLSEEEDVDGFGDEGSTSTEVVIEERRRILKMFVHNAEEDVYTVLKVNSVLKLIIVAKFIAIGVSFRQARNLHQMVKEVTGMGSLGSVSDGEVAQLCRIIRAINL